MSNPFVFFGLVPSINIDRKALRQIFLTIQRSAHPDSLGVESVSETTASLANAHYETLLTDEGLVKAYLLAMGFKAVNQNVLPEDFLMEMMDLNDEITSVQITTETSQLDFSAEQPAAVTNPIAALLLNGAEAGLEDVFQRLKSQVPPDIDELLIWFQKHKYLSRLRKNFEGIGEI